MDVFTRLDANAEMLRQFIGWFIIVWSCIYIAIIIFRGKRKE
jgi:hypothetical protein